LIYSNGNNKNLPFLEMELPIGQKEGNDQDLVRRKSKDSSSSANSRNMNRAQNDHDSGNDERKKKSSSRAEKKGHRGSKTKGKGSKNSDKNNALLGKSEHSALSPRNRSHGIISKSSNRRDFSSLKTRRQSMSSIDKVNKHREPSAQNLVNLSAIFNSKSSKNSGPSSANPSIRSLSSDSKNRKHSDHSAPNPSDGSNRDSTYKSQNNRNQPSSNQSPKNRDRPSSNRSFNSDSKSFFSSHSSDSGRDDGDGKNNNSDTNDFVSDIEDDSEVKCSVVDIPSVIDNGEKDNEASLVSITLNDKDRTCSRQRSRETKNNNRDPDSKQKMSRHRQSSKTDDLGRASSHCKLEGVYFNHRSEPKAQKDKKIESDEYKEIEVLTKLPTDSNEKDTTNRTPTKGRYRSRRRNSCSGKDQLTRSRSKNREQPRALKHVTRMRTARSLDRLSTRSSHNKSSDKRIKRGSGTKAISLDAQKAVKKIFGLDTPSLGEDPIVAKNTDQKSLTETENITSMNRPSPTSSMKDAEESTTNTEKINKNMDSPSKFFDKIQRRRSSMGESTKKDRTSTQISKKSGHKSSRKPIREKKSRGKYSSAIEVNTQSDLSKENGPSIKANTNSIEQTISSSEEFVSGSEKEINKILNNGAKGSPKNRSSIEKIGRKDRSSTRRGSVKEKKSRGIDSSAIVASPQSDSSEKNDPDSMVNTSSIAPTISSSVKEFVSESEKEINDILDNEAKTPISITDLLSNTEHDAKKRSKDIVSLVAPSLGSDECEKKDNAKYLQLTFVAEKGADPNNLFALKDEQFDKSFKTKTAKEMKGQSNAVRKSETEGRNTSLRSYANEFDLKVSTNSLSISGSVHDKGLYADDVLSSDDDGFADDIEQETTKKKIISTVSPSGSDGSKKKDNAKVDNTKYLQLTFEAENDGDANNLFALIDEQYEQFNRSFEIKTPKSKMEDRNSSLRSFTNEFDLKVSTTSLSLPKSVSDESLDADDIVEKTTKTKKVSQSFSLSRSLHGGGPNEDNTFANDIEEESTKKKKPGGMLKKMRNGLTEGSRVTFQKASSTRHLLGQATTKVFARRKEEGRGLLRNESD